MRKMIIALVALLSLCAFAEQAQAARFGGGRNRVNIRVRGRGFGGGFGGFGGGFVNVGIGSRFGFNSFNTFGGFGIAPVVGFQAFPVVPVATGFSINSFGGCGGSAFGFDSFGPGFGFNSFGGGFGSSSFRFRGRFAF